MLGFFRPGSRPRITLIVILLVVTAAILAALVDQARRTIRSYRATTERVLSDYANLAASNFAIRAAAELEHFAFVPALRSLESALEDSGRLPPPTPLEVWTNDTTKISIDLVGTAFTMGIGDGASTTLATTGESLPEPAKAWLADTLRVQAREVWRRDWSSAVVVGAPDGAARFVVYAARSSSTDESVPSAVTGFAATVDGLGVFFDYSFGIRPLLSPALTRDTPRDSLVSVTVESTAGHVVFRSSRQHVSRFTAAHPLGPAFGGLVAHATLHPDAARVLVMEGPPRSQLFVFGALSAFAVALLAAAYVLVRREAELARLRSDFVAAVSHELRTPLAQIRLFAETLHAGRVRSEEERIRSLEIIDQEARRLEHLVENVLHVARAERIQPPLAPPTSDIAPLIDDIVLRFAPLARSKRCTIRLDLEHGVYAPVEPDALRQILTNLLDNAMKYGPEAQTITVRSSYENGSARVAVEDEGPGIAPRSREEIWKRFVRLAEAFPNVAGTGIGLSVVRDWAKRHGGDAWVEDSRGRGARFVVRFPGATKGAPDGAGSSP